MFWHQRTVAVVLSSYFLSTPQVSAEELSAKLNANESVLTQHNNNRRTGVYLAETVLTPSNVEHNFGLLYTLEGEDTPDGKDHIGPIVTQPLFVKGVVIGGQAKDVLYVASRTNKIYAFDVSPTGSHAPLWHIELPHVPPILDLEPIAAVWRVNDVNKNDHLDLFATGKDGAVLSNFWDRNDQDWHDWFAIRPDTGRAKTGTPQQITAVWGDPNNPQHLNLFMTDKDGTIKSIFCTLQPGHSCWGHEPHDPVWSPIGGTGIATPGQPVTAVWRDRSHLDLFVAGGDGQVLSNFFESNTWHDWFAIRPDTGRARTGTPQQITAVWGDPNNPQHLNLFMTDQDGTIKSIFCTLQPGQSCWGHEPHDPVWFPVSDAQETNMLTPGQPISAVWRRDASTQFSHLDLFAAGKQETGRYREFGTNAIKQIPGQDIVERPGTVLSNFWGGFANNDSFHDWGTWFPIPLRAEAIPGMDDGFNLEHPKKPPAGKRMASSES
jgi:hypothetical protein